MCAALPGVTNTEESRRWETVSQTSQQSSADEHNSGVSEAERCSVGMYDITVIACELRPHLKVIRVRTLPVNMHIV